MCAKVMMVLAEGLFFHFHFLDINIGQLMKLECLARWHVVMQHLP